MNDSAQRDAIKDNSCWKKAFYLVLKDKGEVASPRPYRWHTEIMVVLEDVEYREVSESSTGFLGVRWWTTRPVFRDCAFHCLLCITINYENYSASEDTLKLLKFPGSFLWNWSSKIWKNSDFHSVLSSVKEIKKPNFSSVNYNGIKKQ